MGCQSQFGDGLGRAGDRSRTPKKPARVPSWGAPDKPRAPRNRPKVSPGRSQDAPGPSWSGIRTRVKHQGLSKVLTARFLVVFVSRCASLDMRFVSVFTMFCGFERSKQRTHASTIKVRKSRSFGLLNRPQERPGNPKSNPGSPIRAAKRAKVVQRNAFF